MGTNDYYSNLNSAPKQEAVNVQPKETVVTDSQLRFEAYKKEMLGDVDMAAAKKEVKRGGWYFMIFIAIFISTSLLSAKFLPVEGVMSILLPEIILWTMIVGFFIITRKNPLKFLRVKKFHIGSFFLVILVGFLMNPVMTFLNAASMIFVRNEISSTLFELSSMPFIVSFLCMAVLPALGEEVTCRGVILNSYDVKRPIKGIIISALCFGFFHMNFNQMLYALVMGIVMGLLVEATDSIWASVTIHLMINGQSTIMLYLLPKLVSLANKLAEISGEEAVDYSNIMNQASSASGAQMAGIAAAYFVPAVICACGICGLVYVIAKINRREHIFAFWFAPKNKELRKQVPKIPTWYPPIIIGLLACFVMCVLMQIGL